MPWLLAVACIAVVYDPPVSHDPSACCLLRMVLPQADGGAPHFTSGTVLRFDMDADDVAASTTLDFRAIRPIFGGREGGVKHCDYHNVGVHLYTPPPSPPPPWGAACTTYAAEVKFLLTADALFLDISL